MRYILEKFIMMFLKSVRWYLLPKGRAHQERGIPVGELLDHSAQKCAYPIWIVTQTMILKIFNLIFYGKFVPATTKLWEIIIDVG